MLFILPTDTAYDKTRKTLVPSTLMDLILCKRGYDWTLVELNKVRIG
jgi:hypothetical protein